MLATIDYLQAELNKPRPAPEELSGDTNQQEKYRKCRMEVAKLNNEITLLKAKLTACGMAARGHNQYTSADPVWSAALSDVIKLHTTMVQLKHEAKTR